MQRSLNLMMALLKKLTGALHRVLRAGGESVFDTESVVIHTRLSFWTRRIDIRLNETVALSSLHLRKTSIHGFKHAGHEYLLVIEDGRSRLLDELSLELYRDSTLVDSDRLSPTVLPNHPTTDQIDWRLHGRHLLQLAAAGALVGVVLGGLLRLVTLGWGS